MKRIYKIGFLIVIFVGGVLLGKNLFKDKEKTVEIIDEESIVTKVVDKSMLSVVTVSIGTSQDIGTGFVITSDGLIVTNKHVVADLSAEYNVLIGKDERVEVQNIYRDPIYDLAILKVNKVNLIPVDLGDSDQLKVGQTVIAIGTALGEFRSTVTKGVISGLGRGITAGSNLTGLEKLDDVIQTDAAINPGNSGGPLFNSAGQVIGVNVAVSQSAQSIGFALPINMVKESIDNFRATGQFDRPYLGVGYAMVKTSSDGIPMGAYVQEVATGSPAEKAGVGVGDVITQVDGNNLADDKNTTLATYINKKKIGDKVTLKIWRNKNYMEFTVVLEKKS
ncbi:MAG: trypsin-like peptidase domain-containing protein [Candidatus Shapirobacteria bacterium]|jgi:S1-C subfamily serine protease